MTVAVTAVGREVGTAIRRAPAAPDGTFAGAVARAVQAPAAPRADAAGAGKAKTLAAAEAETRAPEAAPAKTRKDTGADQPMPAAKHKPQAATPAAAMPANVVPAVAAAAQVSAAPPMPAAERHEQGAGPAPGSSTDDRSHVVTADVTVAAGASGSATAGATAQGAPANAGPTAGGDSVQTARGPAHAVLADAAPAPTAPAPKNSNTAAPAAGVAGSSRLAGDADGNTGATVSTAPRSAGRTNADPKPSEAKAEVLTARPLDAGRAGAPGAAAAAALTINPALVGAGSASSAGSSASAVASVAAVSASLGLAQTTAAAAPAAASPAAGPPALAGQPAAALAAAVTAMVQDGKNTLQIRLDPPELGSLSIHLAVGQDAKVNVLLLAAVPQTATAFAAGADDLRQAFAASGLALGQLNVGGESGAGRDDNRRQSTARPVQLLGDATNSAAVGVRAIA